MSEPFLILHKVRGEPTFDIAERWSFDSEEGWIISTSGHRAYPYWFQELNELGIDTSWPGEPEFSLIGSIIPIMPTNWPDHYVSNDRPIREATYNVSARAAGLLAKLGLVSKVERRD